MWFRHPPMCLRCGPSGGRYFSRRTRAGLKYGGRASTVLSHSRRASSYRPSLISGRPSYARRRRSKGRVSWDRAGPASNMTIAASRLSYFVFEVISRVPTKFRAILGRIVAMGGPLLPKTLQAVVAVLSELDSTLVKGCDNLAAAPQIAALSANERENLAEGDPRGRS